MIFLRKFCAFGCVIVFANALVHVVNETELSNNRNPVSTGATVTPMPLIKDDRLYFELPQWFKSINTSAPTPTTPTPPSVPARARINTGFDARDSTSMEPINNTITFDGEYDFR